jgi:hypothetical protein
MRKKAKRKKRRRLRIPAVARTPRLQSCFADPRAVRWPAGLPRATAVAPCRVPNGCAGQAARETAAGRQGRQRTDGGGRGPEKLTFQTSHRLSDVLRPIPNVNDHAGGLRHFPARCLFGDEDLAPAGSASLRTLWRFGGDSRSAAGPAPWPPSAMPAERSHFGKVLVSPAPAKSICLIPILSAGDSGFSRKSPRLSDSNIGFAYTSMVETP